jgi:hypothetical protein
MRNWIGGVMLVVAVGVGFSLGSYPTAGQTPASQIPRMPGGKPNLNGLWQAVNTANWNIQDHPASQGPVIALGAAFSVPEGRGVVEGKSARAEETERSKLDDARSRAQVLPPRRPARHVHALSLPDRPDAGRHPDRLRVPNATR